MIVPDGKLNETSWQKAPWSSYFVDIEGEQKSAPSFQTRFKMLWDDEHLYIGAELEENNIWANITGHDQIVFHDNDFEIFIDPEGDGRNYFEIEINVLKTVFDLVMPKPYRDWGKAFVDWDAKNMIIGIDIDGTINKPGDIDKKWTVEFAIPFDAFDFNGTPAQPVSGTIWRMNFSRVEWNTEIKRDQYEKKKDSSGKNLPEDNWVWSSQGLINMHYPERWGYVMFKEATVKSDTTFDLPFSEKLKSYLWLIYYKQRTFFTAEGHYASSLSILNIPEEISTEYGLLEVQLNSSPAHFEAIVTCESLKEQWTINEDGKLFKSF